MEIKTELVLDSSQHEMDRNNRMLLLVNAGLFIVIGSIISRLHVLQAWMGVNYEEFAWVLFCFSCGSILSNLMPRKMCELMREPIKRHFHELFPFIQFSQCETNPIPIKAMMNLVGMPAGECRLPLTQLSHDNKKKLEAAKLKKIEDKFV